MKITIDIDNRIASKLQELGVNVQDSIQSFMDEEGLEWLEELIEENNKNDT